MRVIYATSDLELWVDVAKNMQDRLNWEPIYWVTTPKNDLHVKSSFPLTICQDYIDAIRGKYTYVHDKNPRIALDKALLETYYYHERIALKMMDRMDPTAYSFNLSERVDLYYEFLQYWLNKIDILKPDVVVFSESPHGLFQYLLYAVCLENNIRILRFTPTHIDGLTFLSSSLKEVPLYLIQEYEKCLKDNCFDKSLVVANSNLENKRGPYKQALPYYMKDVKKRTLYKNIQAYMGKASRFIKNDIFSVYKKGSSYSIRESNITKIDLLSYKVRGYFVKKNLEKVYNGLAKSPDLKQSYIYVALHYQPEKTTSPEGDIYVDQLLMISMLSLLVPDGWKVYVKEHISQFSDKFFGEQGRNRDFYLQVSRIKNVQFIKSDFGSFDLIDHAKAVATVTGSVGLEAVIRSKPVLCFGDAWYQLCHGVFNIKNNQDLKEAMALIQNNYLINDANVNAFLYAIERVSFPCYLNQGNIAGVGCSEEENIQNLTSCLVNFAAKI